MIRCFYIRYHGLEEVSFTMPPIQLRCIYKESLWTLVFNIMTKTHYSPSTLTILAIEHAIGVIHAIRVSHTVAIEEAVVIVDGVVVREPIAIQCIVAISDTVGVIGAVTVAKPIRISDSLAITLFLLEIGFSERCSDDVGDPREDDKRDTLHVDSENRKWQ
jgi:hypothetical protein